MGNKGTASYLDIRNSTIYTNKGPVLYPLKTGLYHHNDGGSSKDWRWKGILDTIHDDNDWLKRVCLAYCVNTVLNVKALVKHFQPGEGPCRGLLRDCEIFANLRIAFVSSSNDEGCWL